MLGYDEHMLGKLEWHETCCLFLLFTEVIGEIMPSESSCCSKRNSWQQQGAGLFLLLEQLSL